MGTGAADLPAAWREAFRRDAESDKPLLADPLPERRLARLLAAFISTGLAFLVLPGTLLGVWNLMRISSGRNSGSASTAWIQAHGHAQLLGWVGAFMIGIVLYTVPKFRRSSIRSVPVGWVMLGLWSAAVTLRWYSALWSWHWQTVWPLAAGAELAVALLVVWQISGRGAGRDRPELYLQVMAFGLAGMVLTLALQLILVPTGCVRFPA